MNTQRQKIGDFFNKYNLYFDIKDIPNDSKWTSPKLVEIEPNSCGQISPIFERILLNVSFARDSVNSIYVNLEYKYYHISGSNGYKVLYKFDNKGDLIKKS